MASILSEPPQSSLSPSRSAALGKILALIIMGYSLGQWAAPWMAGKLFDSYHSYDLAWKILAGASLLGAAAIYKVSAGVGRG